MSTAANLVLVESLKDVARRLRASLSQGATAEGVVAVEVMRLSATWDKDRDDAEGMEIGPWLAKYVDGRHFLSWYERRASAYEAAKVAGLHNSMDAHAAVWWVAHVAKSDRADKSPTTEQIRKVCKGQNRVPTSLQQVKRICHEFISARPENALKNAIAHIERLKKQIVGLGAEPVG